MDTGALRASQLREGRLERRVEHDIGVTCSTIAEGSREYSLDGSELCRTRSAGAERDDPRAPQLTSPRTEATARTPAWPGDAARAEPLPEGRKRGVARSPAPALGGGGGGEPNGAVVGQKRARAKGKRPVWQRAPVPINLPYVPVPAPEEARPIPRGKAARAALPAHGGKAKGRAAAARGRENQPPSVNAQELQRPPTAESDWSHISRDEPAHVPKVLASVGASQRAKARAEEVMQQERLRSLNGNGALMAGYHGVAAR